MSESANGATETVKTLSADLRAMLMVGQKPPNSQRGSRGGRRGKNHQSQQRISYDKEALIAIGKNAASQRRPDILDPAYDSKPSAAQLAMGAPAQARWDPEKWHTMTKPKRTSTTTPAPPVGNNAPTKENNDWRKEDEEPTRLGPQRRSFAGGCKPAAKPENQEIVLGPKRGGGGVNAERQPWRPSRIRDNESRDNDKFHDFRGSSKGEKYNAAERFGSRNNNRRFNRQFDEPEEEEVPEWMTDGPDNVNEVLDLDKCVLPGHEPPPSDREEPGGRDSPELVAFDFATGGVVEEALEEEEKPKGLVDFHSKELDALLEQIDSDEDQDRGVSRFSSFFNKPTPQGPPQQAPLQQPQPQLGQLHQLGDPRSDLGLRVQQQRAEERRLVDPAVWATQQQQQQRPQPPPQMPNVDPAVLDMGSLRDHPAFAQPPNLLKMPPLPMSLQQPVPQSMAQPPRAPLQVPAAAQVMSLEELERGVNPNTPEAQVAAQSQPNANPEVKAMLLNLTSQKSDFERKSNMQRMMLLQQQPKQQQQPIGQQQQQPPPPQPQHYGQLGARTANSFGLDGGGARAINGLVGMAPPGHQPPQQQQQQQQQRNHAERDRIYAYLMGEKRHRTLTPSEEKFLEKNTPQQAELMSQMALHDEIQKQMAMMDPRNSRSGGGAAGPPLVNGLGARELEAHQQRQAEQQRQQQQQQRQYQEQQKGISLERQKAQFEEFGRQQQKGGDKSVSSSFTTHFTPTSVMRKMVRKAGDEEGRGGARKITPLEHTGVVRVPKGGQDHLRQKNQKNMQQQQQPPARNLLSQFPPLNNPMNQPAHRQGTNGSNGTGSNMAPFMLQQLMFQQQMTQNNNRNTQDIFRQQQQAPQPPRGFEPEQGNAHIEKLLNQQNYDY